MKVLALRHIGIIVDNLDLMIQFYIGLGFQSRSRELEANSFVRDLTKLDLLGFETTKMYLDQKSRDNLEVNLPFVLELLKPIYYNENSHIQKIVGGGTHLNFGMHDISLTVDDIEHVLEYVRLNNGCILSGPLKPVSQYAFPSLHSYCLDPEGNILHIAQNLSR